MAGRKLEIGPGEFPLGDGWETADCVQRPGLTHLCDWSSERLPVDDGTFELVYTSHAIEHLPWYRIEHALGELFRVLVPGGSVEIWTVDFSYLVRRYLERRAGDGWRRCNPEGDPMKWLAGRVFGYGSPENWHRSLFDWPYLRDCLRGAGFRPVERIDATERPRGYDHGQINLGVRAFKPARESRRCA